MLSPTHRQDLGFVPSAASSLSGSDFIRVDSPASSASSYSSVPSAQSLPQFNSVRPAPPYFWDSAVARAPELRGIISTTSAPVVLRSHVEQCPPAPRSGMSSLRVPSPKASEMARAFEQSLPGLRSATGQKQAPHFNFPKAGEAQAGLKYPASIEVPLPMAALGKPFSPGYIERLAVLGNVKTLEAKIDLLERWKNGAVPQPELQRLSKEFQKIEKLELEKALLAARTARSNRVFNQVGDQIISQALSNVQTDGAKKDIYADIACTQGWMDEACKQTKETLEKESVPVDPQKVVSITLRKLVLKELTSISTEEFRQYISNLSADNEVRLKALSATQLPIFRQLLILYVLAPERNPFARAHDSQKESLLLAALSRASDVPTHGSSLPFSEVIDLALKFQIELEQKRNTKLLYVDQDPRLNTHSVEQLRAIGETKHAELQRLYADATLYNRLKGLASASASAASVASASASAAAAAVR